MTKQNKKLLVTGAITVGNVAGILVAIKRKSGFLGGVGWFLLLGAAGMGVGYVAASMIPDTDEGGVTEKGVSIASNVSSSFYNDRKFF
mgnify:CR=1 FL=1